MSVFVLNFLWKMLTCSFLKKDIKFSKGGHEFVFFEMWDERPHTQYQLSMIRFYLPLNQLILWPSESQTCQNWAQLLKGSLSTNFTYLGEIISIFVYIFRFCWESWLISTFDLHFGLQHFYCSSGPIVEMVEAKMEVKCWYQ